MTHWTVRDIPNQFADLKLAAVVTLDTDNQSMPVCYIYSKPLILIRWDTLPCAFGNLKLAMNAEVTTITCPHAVSEAACLRLDTLIAYRTLCSVCKGADATHGIISKFIIVSNDRALVCLIVSVLTSSLNVETP